MNKKKIYIAGKVSGEDMASCTMKFGIVQQELERMGYEVINPLEVVPSFNMDWQTAMRLCICKLMTCHGVFLLQDYTKSRGAMIENNIALNLKFPQFKTFKQLKNYQWNNLQPTP